MEAGRVVSFVVVVNGADMLHMGDASTAGPRYTRDSVRGLLQTLGCKPRHAYKIMKLVFHALEQRLAVAQAAQAAPACSKARAERLAIQVHKHHPGSAYLCISRPDFLELIASSAAQYEYRLAPSSEDLRVSCRCALARLWCG